MQTAQSSLGATSAKSVHSALTTHAVLGAVRDALPELDRAILACASSNPHIARLLHALCSYFTNAIPASSANLAKAVRRDPIRDAADSLLTQCITEALHAWSSAPDELKFRSFVEGLLKHTHRVAVWQAYFSRGLFAESWDFCSAHLLQWIGTSSKHPFLVQRQTIVSPPLKDLLVRNLVATRLLIVDDYEWLNFHFRDMSAISGTPTYA